MRRGTEPTDQATTTVDGVVKQEDSRADAWNWRNNPTAFRTELSYQYDELPLEGHSAKPGWADTYWPYVEDGINARWQGPRTLSPAEKYDKAFKGWTEPEGFMDLKPFDISTCEFDAAYYDQIGPTAKWTHENKGTGRLTNGIDDDRDGIEDKDECTSETDKHDFEGLETWWGICHAWSPAAIMEDEPLKPVERNGIVFEVSDIKALLMQQYDKTEAYMVGGRCEEREIVRDEDGRVTNEDCRDLNAGTFHVILANFLGKNQRPMVIERTTNYEVWNQPLVGFKVTSQKELTLEEAHALLGVAPGTTPGSGTYVNNVEEGSPEGEAILKLANEGTLTELDDDARLYATAAKRIVAERPFNSLAQLDAIPYITANSFATMLTYAKISGRYVEPTVEYKYNSRAERFIEIRATTDWIAESNASRTPTSTNISRYTRHDYYHYILEIDGEGKIIGGEWLDSSITNHPDFLWLPVKARGGNPNIDLEKVREMVRESRADVDTDVTENTLTFRVDTAVAIPDNDPRGAVSALEIRDEGAIKGITIDLEIEHTYRGDLIVELQHGGTSVIVYDGTREANAWEDNVSLTGEVLEGFTGASMTGGWELTVRDTAAADIGRIVKWSINVTKN
ncbi:MAG: proprotein convertase P-domain-containing protein [bacterium]